MKKELLAPNGKPSNLTPEQYALVRTPQFKAWFGDWENEPESASKVIDENGEPLVVYHGTKQEFYIFGEGKNQNILPEYQEEYAFKKKVNYFHKDKIYSETFGSKYGGYEKAFFLYIDKIELVDEDTIEDIGYWKNIYDYYVLSEGLSGIYSKSGQFATLLNSNQIKLADGTNTTFDENNPDIRYQEGGKTKKNMKKINKGGITYGRSHAEGGIPVKNQSTGEMLEVEGGEGIINKKAMASPQMVKIDGKEMTICEAASYLNQKDGNGRQFNCDDVEHQQFITDHYGVGGELKKGIATEKEHSKTLKKLYYKKITPKAAIREVAKEHIKENPKYYSNLQKMEGKMAKGGTVMNNQDAENAMFDATVFEHGGTVNAYDAGLHKKMYMLGIEVMQSNPIALAKVMSKENDNFCDHYPKLCAGAEYQREELPQIYDKNYDEFVAYLENLGATVSFESDVEVDSLKPVQNEISLERMARIMVRVKDGYYKDLNLLKLPLFVSKDGYILDGHHRWATLFFLSPTNTLDIYRVNLTYKQLVDNALNFDDAGTEKFMIGGMVNKQEQLDDASKITLRFTKGKVDCYYNFQNMEYNDLVRIEGSNQALLQGKFNPILWGYVSTGQFLNSYLYSENVKAIRELQKTSGFDDWKIISEYSAIQEKRSVAVDFYLNKQKTSDGILELFDTSLPNYNMFIGELYCETVVQYIKEIMNLLSSDDWRKRGEGSFQSTAEYQLASYFYQLNISQIYRIAQNAKDAEDAGQSYDLLKADTNFVSVKEAERVMNTMFSAVSAPNAATATTWNWRFKTEEEFIDQYGTNWKPLVTAGVTEWEEDMDYLLGQKIVESDESREYIQRVIDYETGYGFDLKRFGILRPNEVNAWEISADMIINKPLPTAASTASSQVISAYKKAFFGSKSDLSNEYNLTQTKFKEVRRYTYMSWEDLVYFYNKAALQPETEIEFVRAVYIVMNNARLGGFFYSEGEVRYSLQNNDPNDLMKALFSKTYYFAPLTYQFYEFNFERYIQGWFKSVGGSRRLQTPRSPELDFMIQIPQISSYINTAIQKNRGLIGLGCSLTSGSVSYYPDIVTNIYSSNILDAFGKSDIELLNITEISANLRYNSNSISYGFFETLTDYREYVRPEFTLLGSMYGKFFVDLYNQIGDIPTDKTYIYDDDSPLKKFQLNQKPVQDNEYIYTPFAEDLIEPVYVITDVDALLTNFQAHNIIAPNEYSAMYDVCKKCKLFKGQPNDNFLNDYYYVGQSLNFGQLLSESISLTADEEKTLEDFLNLFRLWVMQRSADYVMGKVKDAYANNKSGVNTTQRTQFTVPAPTQQKPLPSTDPSTWGEEFKISDNVKIRYDYSTDLGDGASKVPYDSPQNIFKITGQKILAVAVRPENPTGKLYTLSNGQDWEGKDLELVRTAFPQPLPATPPTTQTQQGKPRTREVYYNELLYNGVLKKTEKIVGARFLTEDEIKKMDKSYNLDKLSFGVILLAQDYLNGTKSDVAEYLVTTNLWYKDLLGQKLDDNLLPMVKELFKFQKSLDVADSKALFRSSYEQDKETVRYTRLRLGTSSFSYDSSDVRLLFPKLKEDDYENDDKYGVIEQKPFPDWYKSVIKQLYKSREGSSAPMNFDDISVGMDIIDPYYFFTGQRLDKFSNTVAPYLELPTSYLMLEIEDTSAPVKTQVSATSNPESIKKLKEEYSALQYYLNVEVPIDAFAQRKLISTVMADISNKLEQQIESLYYTPSFEPLFELWADKQTQGQRTINLQPCMLPTPNGEKSELDLVQYEIVRTEEFKKWFGDWEEAAVTGNYNGVSKAINPLTKEPQVVFHGKANMLLEFTKMGFATFPIKYFGTNLSYAEWFRENQSNSNTLIKLVYEFFLDIKNPIDLSPIGLTELTAEDLKEVIKAQYNYEIQSPIVSEGSGAKLKLWQLIRGSSDMLQELKTNTYFDGIIMYEDNPSDRTSLGYESNLLGFSPNSYDIVQKVAGNPQGNFTLDYVTFTNFQIKAADGRNKTFFNKVEDFRFAKGGITKKRKK